MTQEARRAAIEPILKQHAQAHLLRSWSTLNEAQRGELLDDLEAIDIPLAASLVEDYVRRKPTFAAQGVIDAPDALPAGDAVLGTDSAPAALRETYQTALRRGEEAVAAGKAAAFTVAGGQGTRLGYDGPKGGFRISPIRNAPLFQLFAESLRGIARRYGRCPRWYIMTSPGNHAQTIEIFKANDHFGLSPAGIRFFPQGQMPAFLPDGRIAMSAAHRIALSPDGHGGSLRALRTSGALDEMRAAGVEYISYFQVDNPLVKPIDPLFIGLHIARGSEMSSKAVTKAADTERVGNFCRVDGVLQVIEYSDLPESLALAKTADGRRKFDAGSIAIHVIDRALVDRLTAPGAAARLPWHRADKKMPIVDVNSAGAAICTSDVVKLEMFVFDAIPLARNSMVLYTPREEEFSPVKNAEGVDSPATSRRDQIRRAARWLAACGIPTPQRPDGEPDALLEISPAFALDAGDLRSRLKMKPIIERGGQLLLA